MAHPHNELRDHKVQRSRVASIAKGYATGGGVSGVTSADRTLAKNLVKSTAMKMAGGSVSARQDRPNRARGGKVGKKKGTKGNTVNVIIGQPHDKPPMIPGVGTPPPMPPKPPMAPPPGPPMSAGPMPPPGGAPPMPMRARGGKVNANTAGIGKGRTPVQHAPGKQDLKNIGRGPVITKATGGAISSAGGKMAPHTIGGSGGGKSRLDKQNHPAKYTC